MPKSKVVENTSTNEPLANTLPIKIKNFVLRSKFIVLVLMISIFRLWISSDIKLIAIPSNTDDFHYILLAYYIKSGQWLGPLDQLTLHTRTFFPVYLAYLSKMQLPYIFMNHLLYVVSVAFAFFTIRKILKNDIIILLGYTFVLFNPMLYAGDVSRVVREGLWVPLAIFVIFSYFRFLFIEKSDKKRLFYSIISGLSLGSFYLTREDGLMIFPLVGLLSLSYVVFYFKIFRGAVVKNIILLIIPLLLTKTLIYWNTSLNKKYYKVALTYEGELKSAGEFGAVLSQIKQDVKISGIPYSKDTRMKLYAELPEFGKLRNYEDTFLGWSERSGQNQGELLHFGHALKWVLNQAGYYENYRKIDEFYKNAKSDLLKAFDEGRLKRNEVAPTQQKSQVLLFFEKVLGPYPGMLYDLFVNKSQKMIDGLNFALRLDDFKLFETHEFGSVTYGDENVIRIFKEVTNSPLAFNKEESTSENLKKRADSFKNKFMLYNYNIYSSTTIWLFYLALVSGIAIVLVSVKDKNALPVIFLISCLSIIAIRIYILVTIMETNNLFSVKYLSLVHTFIFFYIAFSIGFIADFFYKKYSFNMGNKLT